MRVLHIITDLYVGGAEILLHRLLQANLGIASQEVVSLTAPGPMSSRIRELGVPVHALGMRRELPSPFKVLTLARIIRNSRADVIQTWMYHADLLGGLAAKVTGTAKIVWGIHSSTLDVASTRRRTRATVAACARLSHLVPDRIICVSRAGRDLHVRAGYAPGKFVVIPNGFDLQHFRPDERARRDMRAELRVDDDTVLIGLIARVAPQKDHANFVRAGRALVQRAPRVRFLLSGEGATRENHELVRLIADAGLLDRFLLLGLRDDIARVMNALDVGTLSSAFGEAFPLAIGEAMACGVPCVVTDLGDCAFLVGDTGRVVRTHDPHALAGAWEELVKLGPDGRRQLGLAARTRIATRFEFYRMAAQYKEVYRALGDATAEGISDK